MAGATVAGIDGCRSGWVVATMAADAPPPTSVRIEVIASFGPVIERLDDDRDGLELAGVDMPIGLLDAGRRACDVEARARLGLRRSSVFPTPVRAALGAPDYPTALARSRAADGGRGLSKQSYFLLPKIAEIDALVTSGRQAQLVECHPESCFASLAGSPLPTSKRTAEGLASRRALLRPEVSNVDELVATESARRPRRAQADDVLDALVVAVAMRAHRRGRSIVVGGDERDPRGLAMRIVVGRRDDRPLVEH